MMKKETLSPNVPTMKMFAPSWDPNDEMMMIKRILESGWQSGSHEMRWQELQLCEVAICPGFEEEGWQEERNENDLRRWSGRIFW